MHNFNKLRRKRKGAVKLKIIDLSRTITPGMQGFPGDAAPAIERREDGGFRTASLSLCSHAGTHVDAPAHLSSQSVTLDMMPPETFWGLALLADVRAAAGRGIEIADLAPHAEKLAVRAAAGRGIEIADLAPHAEKLAEADFLLLRTGWEEKFGKEEYLAGFPTLSREAAQYALSLGIRGFGFDTISADAVDSETCPIHRTLLGAGALIIENLRGLYALPEGETFLLAALPMPLAGADGAPARVMAVLEN